jgi:hypothetical protein
MVYEITSSYTNEAIINKKTLFFKYNSEKNKNNINEVNN